MLGEVQIDHYSFFLYTKHFVCFLGIPLERFQGSGEPVAFHLELTQQYPLSEFCSKQVRVSQCKSSLPFTMGHNSSPYDYVIHVALIGRSRFANYQLPTSTDVQLCEGVLSNSVTQTSEGVAGDECYFFTLCDINPVNTRHKIIEHRQPSVCLTT